MRGINNLLLAFAIAILTIALTFFTVYQTDLAFVLRFRKIKTDKDNKSIVYKPGIHLSLIHI